MSNKINNGLLKHYFQVRPEHQLLELQWNWDPQNTVLRTEVGEDLEAAT